MYFSNKYKIYFVLINIAICNFLIKEKIQTYIISSEKSTINNLII